MIYLDNFYFGWSANNPTYFNDINEIPTGCDLVGVTFYTYCLTEIVDTIDKIKIKTKKLVVTLNEHGSFSVTTSFFVFILILSIVSTISVRQ